LLALAFVVVYKASGTINFALGELAVLGSRLVATGIHAMGLGLAGAGVGAGATMAAIGVGFNRLVLRHLLGRPLIASIMVTLGLGALIRGTVPLVLGAIPGSIPLRPLRPGGLIRGTVPLGLGGVPGSSPLPLPPDQFDVLGVLIAAEKVLAA